MRFLLLLAFYISSFDAYACAPSTPESFDSFFVKFVSDLSFERQRTQYPYRVENHTEEQSWTVEVSEGKETRNKSLDTVAKEKGFMFAKPILQTSRATAKLYAPNTGYSMVFKFKQSNGCWKFTAMDVNDF